MNKVDEVLFHIACVTSGKSEIWSKRKKAQKVWKEVNPRSLLRNLQSSLNGGVIREWETADNPSSIQRPEYALNRIVELQGAPLPSDLLPTGIPPRREIPSEEGRYQVIENNVVSFVAGEIGIALRAFTDGGMVAEVYVRRPWNIRVPPKELHGSSEPRIILNPEDEGFKTRLQESLAQIARKRVGQAISTSYEISKSDHAYPFRTGLAGYREEGVRRLRTLHPEQSYVEWIEIKK